MISLMVKFRMKQILKRKSSLKKRKRLRQKLLSSNNRFRPCKLRWAAEVVVVMLPWLTEVLLVSVAAGMLCKDTSNSNSMLKLLRPLWVMGSSLWLKHMHSLKCK